MQGYRDFIDALCIPVHNKPALPASSQELTAQMLREHLVRLVIYKTLSLRGFCARCHRNYFLACTCAMKCVHKIEYHTHFCMIVLMRPRSPEIT